MPYYYALILQTVAMTYSTGIGDANRAEDEMIDVIGLFANVLPLRLHAHGFDKFAIFSQPFETKRKPEAQGLEFVESLRHSASLLGAVPATPVSIETKQVKLRGAFNRVSLQDVVTRVVDTVTDSTKGEDGVSFLHHIGDMEFPR